MEDNEPTMQPSGVDHHSPPTSSVQPIALDILDVETSGAEVTTQGRDNGTVTLRMYKYMHVVYTKCPLYFYTQWLSHLIKLHVGLLYIHTCTPYLTLCPGSVYLWSMCTILTHLIV